VEQIILFVVFWPITMNTHTSGVLERVDLLLNGHQVWLYRGENSILRL
jgi:hypothetical protein